VKVIRDGGAISQRLYNQRRWSVATAGMEGKDTESNIHMETFWVIWRQLRIISQRLYTAC
jgi:hypothetical protein